MLHKRNLVHRGSPRFTVLSLLASCFSAPNSAAYPLLFHPGLHSTFIMERDTAAPMSSRKRSRDTAWDPGLARSCSYCVKRMFQCTFMCNQRAEDKEEVKDVAKPKKPPRPLNSYLKVVLDDVTMDGLHEISVKLGRKIQDMSNDTAEEQQNCETEANAGKRKGRPLKFRWRSRKSLHFTFFFGGEVLCAMPADELISWHASVEERLGESRFSLGEVDPPLDLLPACNENNLEIDPAEEEVEREKKYWFRIKELSLFPPRQNPYLIVAILEASPAWHELYNDIRTIALNGNSEALRSLTERGKGGEFWIPHITLGNLYGGNRDDKDAVKTMLQEFPLEAVIKNGEIGVKCIAMGGPVPQQVGLDWKFQNRN